MKKNKIIYWIVTGLLSVMMLAQAYMFIFNTDQVAEMFNNLGMPVGLIIPLGVAKLLAVLAIVSRKSALLKKLAYYGLGLDFAAAIGSHLMAGDGNWPAASAAMILLVGSYIYDRKL